MHATIKRWGNSYAIRLTKSDLDRLGVSEGQEVDLDIRSPTIGIDVASLSAFRDPEHMTLDQARADWAKRRPQDWQ